MTETRGRRVAYALRGGAGKGRSIDDQLDQGSLSEIWRQRGETVPSSLIIEVIELAAQQDFNEATILVLMHEKLDKKVKQIEKSAASLRKLLRDAKSLDAEDRHVSRWFLDLALDVPHEHQSYPEEFVDMVLSYVASIKERNYIQVSPAGHWRTFIKQVGNAFERHGQKVAAKDSSNFVRLLTELERQFPGLVFPPQTDGTEGRRS